VRRLVLALAVAGLLAAGCTEAPLPESTQSGQGWRLLGEGRVGSPNTVDVFDERDYELRWSIDENPPAVDYSTELAVRFSPARRSGSKACREARLQDVVIDNARAIVYATYQQIDAKGCKDPVTAYSFVVALVRSALPAQFTLQVSENPPGGDIGAGSTMEVTVANY
jgi:hypothetical protein